jgi:hypothetical protein
MSPETSGFSGVFPSLRSSPEPRSPSAVPRSRRARDRLAASMACRYSYNPVSLPFQLPPPRSLVSGKAAMPCNCGTSVREVAARRNGVRSRGRAGDLRPGDREPQRARARARRLRSHGARAAAALGGRRPCRTTRRTRGRSRPGIAPTQGAAAAGEDPVRVGGGRSETGPEPAHPRAALRPNEPEKALWSNELALGTGPQRTAWPCRVFRGKLRGDVRRPLSTPVAAGAVGRAHGAVVCGLQQGHGYCRRNGWRGG